MSLAPIPSNSSSSSLSSLLLSPSSIHSSSNVCFNIAASPPGPNSAYAVNGPYMGIILIVLFIAFFLVAAFSVYMRRYAIHAGAAGAGARSQQGQGRGLDRAAIDGLPIVEYHGAKGEGAAAQWSRRSDCVVCLADFQEAEKLRSLPRCEHCFHAECIDKWLFSHSTCPLCRQSLLLPPSPAANDEVCISVQAAPSVSVVPSDSRA